MSILTLAEVRKRGFPEAIYSNDDVTEALEYAEDYAFQVTGSWFDVRELTLELDSHGADCLPIPHPIISISRILFHDQEIPLDVFKIYNRHLQGYVDDDDRQNPQIAIKKEFFNRYVSDYTFYNHAYGFHRNFPQGPLTVKVEGKFGWRDYDPTNPEGKVPLMAKKAILMLLKRFLEGEGTSRHNAAWRGHEKNSTSTRNQSCSSESAVTQGDIYGGITGDIVVDRMLSLFVRPVQATVV